MEARTPKYGGGFGTTPFRRRAPEAGGGSKAVQALFGLLGIIAAIAAGIYTYGQEESVWLAIWVAGAALYIVGRALPFVITADKRVRRTLYFLLFPALAGAILYFAHEAWDKWWLAAVVSWVGGFILNALLAPRLFPGIHAEETERQRETLSELSE